jgi:hypothetical protein
MSFGKRQPIGFCGVERRCEIRQKTDVTGQIVLPTGQTARCSVTDISNAGAGLAVASAFGLPEAFELRAAGRKYQVMIIHRGMGHVGIKFV